MPRLADGSFALPLNISEAMAVDAAKGALANASAGRTRMMSGPMSCKEVGGTVCRARFSADRKGVLIGVPVAEKWDDLHSTWNLAFTSRYPHYVFAKLLTPQVGNYHAPSAERPDEYVSNRAIALFVHLHWAYLGRADDARAAQQGKPKSRVATMNWSGPAMTQLWGARNEASAKSYEADVRKAYAGDRRFVNWFDRAKGAVDDWIEKNATE